HLKSSNIQFEGFTQANSSSKLQIGTIKQVKGLEFDTVILPLKSKEQYVKELGSQGVVWETDSDIENPPENAVETLELFITNLYVEVTRARSGLIISYSVEERGITRLIHFTKTKNLPFILGNDPHGSNGIVANNFISDKPLLEKIDEKRWDGKEDYICTSVQYPNPYYFKNAQDRDITLF